MGTLRLGEINLLPAGHVSPKVLNRWLEFMQKRKRTIKGNICFVRQEILWEFGRTIPLSQPPNITWDNFSWKKYLPMEGQVGPDQNGRQVLENDVIQKRPSQQGKQHEHRQENTHHLPRSTLGRGSYFQLYWKTC